MRFSFMAAACVSLVLIGRPAAEPGPTPDAVGQRPLPALVYVSDYFSFVGRDDAGYVAFALDNNRGRDGDAYQAEHFSVLHDEDQGWMEVEGNGGYENPGKDLLTIPDSAHFRFEGTPGDGMVIHSPENDLVLRIEPLRERLSRESGDARFRMASAAAVLEWDGRKLNGRIIHEFLYWPDFNRLTRTYWGLWKDFQGFYISVDGAGDLYLHRQKSKKIAPLTGDLVGFAVVDGRPDPLEGLNLEVTDRRFALGFYRWPVAWELGWIGGGSPVTIKFDLHDRNVLGNWVIGGFAMGIVKGEMFYAGRTRPFYGLAELLM